MHEPNNTVIDGPSYYRLADGTYLEDALWEQWAGMPAPLWDACVYAHRAGHKDGEPQEKDDAKTVHYLRFLARKTGLEYAFVCRMMDTMLTLVYDRHGNPWEVA